MKALSSSRSRNGQGVDEESDDPVEVGVGAAGDRTTDDQVAAAGQGMDRHAEGGEQHGERGGVPCASEFADPVGQLGFDGPGQPEAPAVGGQRPGPETAGAARKVGELDLPTNRADRALLEQPGQMPVGEVRILHWQVR